MNVIHLSITSSRPASRAAKYVKNRYASQLSDPASFKLIENSIATIFLFIFQTQS
jgi:hypothetical protein